MSIILFNNTSDIRNEKMEYHKSYKRLRFCENCDEFTYHSFLLKFPKTIFTCGECNLNSCKIGLDS